MSIGEHPDQASEAMLFADASNRMHAAQDIPSIMRIAVLAAMKLADARNAAAGLRLEDGLVFSECCQGQDWCAFSWSIGSEEALFGDLIARKTSLIVTDPNTKSKWKNLRELPVETEAIAIPVIGRENNLLACLILFDKRCDAHFDEYDQLLLEQLASMMSMAIENSIQLIESRRVEADLEKSVATYRTLVEQIPAITYIATLDRSRILFVSPQIEDVLGFSQDDFLAKQEIWSLQIHPEDRGRVLGEMRRSLQEDQPFHSEYRIYSKGGKDIWVEDAASKVQDQDQDLYFQGVVYDISARKEAEHKLKRMAHYDQLTGLANRVRFHDRLTQVVAQSKRHKLQFAVLYLDLDGFKAVNDDLGHQTGDELLAETARRLKAHVREVDTVARMGGDEFTIILDSVHSYQNIELVAKKLVDAVSQPYEFVDLAHAVTLSMGIAVYPDNSTNAEKLVTMADHAMYQAKNSGKNCHCFYQKESRKN